MDHPRSSVVVESITIGDRELLPQGIAPEVSQVKICHDSNKEPGGFVNSFVTILHKILGSEESFTYILSQLPTSPCLQKARGTEMSNATVMNFKPLDFEELDFDSMNFEAVEPINVLATNSAIRQLEAQRVDAAHTTSGQLA